jgi:hypothetical protein
LTPMSFVDYLFGIFDLLLRLSIFAIYGQFKLLTLYWLGCTRVMGFIYILFAIDNKAAPLILVNVRRLSPSRLNWSQRRQDSRLLFVAFLCECSVNTLRNFKFFSILLLLFIIILVCYSVGKDSQNNIK